MQEHRLTLALHAQIRIKYLTGCLYRVSSHALTSYINTQQFSSSLFFFLLLAQFCTDRLKSNNSQGFAKMQVCRIIIPLSLVRLQFGKGTDMTAVEHRFVQHRVLAALGPQPFYGASDTNYHLKAQQRQVEHCKSYGRKGRLVFFLFPAL